MHDAFIYLSSPKFTIPLYIIANIIAYVFGQLQHPDSVPSLIKVLSNTSELNMVRHEAAEALGSIATPECFKILKDFCKDGDRTVRESCVVGLDMYEFENSKELI